MAIMSFGTGDCPKVKWCLRVLSRITPKVFLLFFLVPSFVTIQAVLITSKAETYEDYWRLVKSAIDSGGPNAADALSLLAFIDNQQARDLLTSVFEGTDAIKVEYASSGLSASQCEIYLRQLEKAALNPAIQPKVRLLSAIGRANTKESARILGAVADQGVQPTAGVAFGVLEQMGLLADPVLEKEATAGQAPWARETAASILRRSRRAGAAAAFKLNLIDTDMNVRIAGALGLAQMGISDGRAILQASARNRRSEYWTEALVALAGLGDPRAVKDLSSALNDATETSKGQIVWAIARFGGVNLKSLAYRLRLEENPIFLSMFVEKLLQPSDPPDLSLLRKEAYSDCSQAVGMIALQRLLEAGENTKTSESIRCGLSSNDEHVQQLAVATAIGAHGLWPDLADSINSPVPAVEVGALIAIQKLNQKSRFKLVENYLRSDVRILSLTAAKTLASLDPKQARITFQNNMSYNSEYVPLYCAAMLLTLDRDAH